MADSSACTQPHFSFSHFNSHFPPKLFNQGKSHYNTLFKSLFFALFLVVLPLFPSQTPEPINQKTIFTKLWEILHLLCIGIAVAYGLLSRKNVEADRELETHDSISVDTISSIFFSHDGYESPCVFDENPMYFEVCKHRLLVPEGNSGDSVRYDGSNVVQARNSDYSECGEAIGYRSLGLPIRSLRSVSREEDSPKYTNESDDSSKGSYKCKDRDLGSLSPFNLEQKIDDGAESSSRTRRKERECRHGDVSCPSHFRPLSIDETELESLSSHSLLSKTSFSSYTSMCSSSDSNSSDNMHFQEEGVEQNRKNTTSRYSSIHGRMEAKRNYAYISHPSHLRSISVDETQFEPLSSETFQSMESFSSQKSTFSSLHSSSSSPSPPLGRKEEISMAPFHSRGYSIDSLLQNDTKTNMKAPSKGKSVRTRRASGIASMTMRTGEVCSKKTDENVEKKPNNVDSMLIRKGKIQSGGHDLNACCPKLEVTISNHLKRDHKEGPYDKCREESDIELETSQVISDEAKKAESVVDLGPDSEVDKKASEFIAKFKAHFRLQRMASVERSKGPGIVGNCII